MKTFIDSNYLAFGKYRAGGAEARTLGEMPAEYLRWLGRQDFLYRERELQEYIAARLERDVRKEIAARLKAKLKDRPSPAREARMTSSLREFAKTL